MNQSKVHSQGNVPFAWENQPGISKVTHTDFPSNEGRYVLKLPPPPCHVWSLHSPKVVGQHDLQIPLPPCPFNPPLPTRSSSRKGLRRDNDPFLAAYKECTKTVKSGKGGRKGREGRIGSLFSCKHSCDVKENSFVRLSQLNTPLTREEEADLDAK